MQIPVDHGSETTVNGWHDYFNIIFQWCIFQGNLVDKRQMAVSCKCLEVLEVCCMCERSRETF
jgi:hypothetical protein